MQRETKTAVDHKDKNQTDIFLALSPDKIKQKIDQINKKFPGKVAILLQPNKKSQIVSVLKKTQ